MVSGSLVSLAPENDTPPSPVIPAKAGIQENSDFYNSI